jgi:predicted nucleotidyltransferase
VTLLGEVVRLLGAQGIRHAVIGAAAMAVHGISRSTLDIDLFTTDARALSGEIYRHGFAKLSVDARIGDADDPLAGIVRIAHEGDRDVDIVVGRAAWQTSCLERAEVHQIEDVAVPVVTAADLILLKLYAAGSQDAWDIEQLLALPIAAADVSAISQRVGALPAPSRALWHQLRARRKQERPG